jgi:hypothetical protein
MRFALEPNAVKRPSQAKLKVLNTLVLLICVASYTWGQIIYAAAYDQNTGQEILFKVNLNTCEFCAVAPPSPNVGGADVVFLPDGSQLHIEGVTTNGLKRLSTPPALTLLWQTNTSQTWYGGVLAPNGLVYLAGVQGLGTFNPANNTVTYIGNWPSTFAYVDDLFYVNGILYGTMSDINGLPFLIQVDVNNPGQSTVVGPFFTQFAAEGGTWNGVSGVFNIDINTDISFYNPATGINSVICDMPPNLIIVGLSFPPPGLPEYDCICTTNAGVLPAAGPFNICTNSTLDFPAATQTNLDPDDVLRYVLFTDLADTAGSIVATNSVPSFVFDSVTMQTGVTYYIAAVAGDELNGNVDLDDPCLDFSNALQVVWRPLPSVAFSLAGSPDVCAGGCRTVTATFTGTPPFILAYTTPEGSFTQTVTGNTGSFQVCVPTGTPPGALVVQATSLTDAWCTCP